jgi:hypothetical protein
MCADGDGSLESFARSAVERQATYVVMSMEPEYWFFEQVFAATPGQFSHQSIWMTPESDPACPVCGAPEARTSPCILRSGSAAVPLAGEPLFRSG